MKKLILFTMLFIPLTSYSNYNYVLKLDPNIVFKDLSIQDGSWKKYEPVVSEWLNKGEVYSCSTWLPELNLYNDDQLVIQSSNCLQKQSRTVQNREIDTNTNEIRNKGTEIQETQDIPSIKTRDRNGLWAGTTYTVNVGRYNKIHYGFVDDLVASTYKLIPSVIGGINNTNYKGFVLNGLYYNLNQGLIFAIDKEAPNSMKPPVITINGITCSTSSIIYENAHFDAYYYRTCPVEEIFTAPATVEVFVK